MKNFILRNKLIILLLFLLINNIIWFQLGGAAQHWDSAVHLVESLNANHIGEEPTQPFVKQLLNVSWYYPPFVSYASIPFYKIFGESEFTGLIVITFFLLILVFCVYLIAKDYFDENVAFLSASLVAFSPIVIHFSRDFMQDLPLASLVAVSVLFLIRSNLFSNSKYSLLFGISLGFGFLTRWTFPLFIISPFAFVFFQILKKSPEKVKRFRNLIVATLTGLIISAPWYLAHILPILVGRSGELNRGNRSSFQDMTYYISVLPEQVSWIITLFLLLGIIFYFKVYRKSHIMLLLWFAGAYLFLTIISFKLPRFSISLLLPLIIASSAGIVAWANQRQSKKQLRFFALISVFIIIVFQYLLITYIPVSTNIGRFFSKQFFSASIIPVEGPEKNNWQQQQIIYAVKKAMDKTGKTHAVLRIVPDHQFFNRQTFDYQNVLKRFPIVISGISGFPMFTDFIVIKTNNLGEDTIKRKKLSESIIKNSLQTNPLFREINRFTLPDKSEAILYHVISPVVNNVSNKTILNKVEILSDRFLRRYFHPLEGYTVTASEYDSLETTRGNIKKLIFKISKAEFGDFSFKKHALSTKDIEIELLGLKFNPEELVMRDSLQILSLKGLHINSFCINADDLKEYIETSSNKKTLISSLTIKNGLIRITAHQKKPDIYFTIGLKVWTINNKNLEFSFDEVKISSVPVHPVIVNILTDSFNPLIKGLDFISEVWIGNLNLSKNELRFQ